MPNIHTPERLTNETQSAYRERRAKHKQAVRDMTLAGRSGGSTSRQIQRDEMRKSGSMSKRRRFADVLTAAWARKRRNQDAYIKAWNDWRQRTFAAAVQLAR